MLGNVRSRVVAVVAVAALLAGVFLAAAPVRAEPGEHSASATAAAANQADESAYGRYVIYGPYATWRRANEVANYARSLG